jgi:hypothetical protein
LQARLVQRAQQRLAAEVYRVFDEDLIGLAEVGQRPIPLQRQNEVAAVYLCAGMEPPDNFFMFFQCGQLDKLVGNLALAIPVRGQCAEHTCDDAHALPLFKGFYPLSESLCGLV